MAVRRRRQTPLDDPGNIGDDIAAGPPSSSDSDEPKPIGVPKGYEVAVRNQDRPGYYPHGFNYTTRTFGAGADPLERSKIIGPRYTEGAEWKPAQTSPAAVSQLQRAMATAGLLDEFQLGVWDGRSAKAYAQVLAYANASGLTAQSALTQMVNNPQLSMTGGEGGRGRVTGFDENGNPIYAGYEAPPLELNLPNEQDVQRVVRSAIIEKLGQGWSQAEVANLSRMFVDRERQRQTGIYNQRVGIDRAQFEGREPGSNTIVAEQAMDPETFVEGELRRRDPTGYQAAGVIEDSLPMFLEALRGWSA